MRFAVFMVMLVLFAATASAQGLGGYIGLYSDHPGYSDECLNEVIGLNNVYVVHTLAVEGSYAKLRVAIHNWNVVVQPTDYHDNVVVGDIYTGVELWYPDYGALPNCQPLPHLLATLSVISTSIAPPCEATVRVGLHPSGTTEVRNCSGNTLGVTRGKLTVNANLVDCPCMWDPIPGPIATQPTTWGAIKSLYR